MDAATALLKTAIGLLKIGAEDKDLYGRMTRLAGQALFALGRAGLDTFVEPDINKEWLKASDFERDGLSQTRLRERVIEFKHTKTGEFNAIFSGNTSLPLHKTAVEFFHELQSKRLERDRIICMSLGTAFLLLAEDRYATGEPSLREFIEQKSAVKKIIKTQADLMNFLSLTYEFDKLREQFTTESDNAPTSANCLPGRTTSC